MEVQKPNKLVNVAEFGLLGIEGFAFVERMDELAENLDEAAETFARDGVVGLSPGCQIDIADQNGDNKVIAVEELTIKVASRTVARLQALWNSEHREAVIKQKDYGAYNGTERHMRTVSFENVQEHFGSVIELQNQLTPTIRRVINDPTVEISTDKSEGTVINLQLFELESPAETRQEHGAHTDRVDTTVVICLDNVGPQGDFVYLKGYNDACRSLGIDPHRDFASNMTRVLAEKPEAVVFRVYGVHPGRMLVIRSDQDVHFITAKSRGNVGDGILSGAEADMLGESIIGRGIINAAFETERCRQIFDHAQEIYKEYNELTKLRGDDYFKALDTALKTEIEDGSLDEDKLEDMRNACVTQMSAEQLYND